MANWKKKHLVLTSFQPSARHERGTRAACGKYVIRGIENEWNKYEDKTYYCLEHNL